MYEMFTNYPLLMNLISSFSLFTDFHPTQVSTPMPGQATNTALVQDAQFSPLHNALYLYLARILRPVWASSVAKETLVDGKPVVSLNFCTVE